MNIFSWLLRLVRMKRGPEINLGPWESVPFSFHMDWHVSVRRGNQGIEPPDQSPGA